MWKIFFLLIPIFGLSQEKIPKNANAIEVKGVSFRQVADGLLDAGYTLERTDSSFQTIKTEFKTGIGKNKWMKLRLMIRVKDTTATITGEWYNTMFIGSKLLGVEQTIDNSTYKIEYTSGNPKNCFTEMNNFALSLHKPILYIAK